MKTDYLTLEQLPYGHEAGLVTDLFAIPRKIVQAVGGWFASLGEAIDLHNRYVELNGLSDATLKSRGIDREAIPQIIAAQAGLVAVPVAPVASNSNLRTVRPAA